MVPQNDLDGTYAVQTHRKLIAQVIFLYNGYENNSVIIDRNLHAGRVKKNSLFSTSTIFGHKHFIMRNRRDDAVVSQEIL